MVSYPFFQLLVACLSLCSVAAGACSSAGMVCQKQTDCCGFLTCNARGKCKNPGKYAKQWLKASRRRRKALYRDDGVGTKNATVKWSFSLQNAAQNWTDYLIQQDECQATNNATRACYVGQEGFFKYCKLTHEGNEFGRSDPYGLENLASAAGPLTWVTTKGTAEMVMQGWWDSEQPSMGGHFYTAAKMSSRYMGCGYSVKEVPHHPGYYCRITSCRYMSKCGTLYEAEPACNLCPEEGC